MESSGGYGDDIILEVAGARLRGARWGRLAAQTYGSDKNFEKIASLAESAACLSFSIILLCNAPEQPMVKT
jgi:hypothetical protein